MTCSSFHSFSFFILDQSKSTFIQFSQFFEVHENILHIFSRKSKLSHYFSKLIVFCCFTWWAEPNSNQNEELFAQNLIHCLNKNAPFSLNSFLTFLCSGFSSSEMFLHHFHLKHLAAFRAAGICWYGCPIRSVSANRRVTAGTRQLCWSTQSCSCRTERSECASCVQIVFCNLRDKTWGPWISKCAFYFVFPAQINFNSACSIWIEM